MKVVFILSDALRHDYIKYMPFLLEMSCENEYFENVIPGIGFCEISEYVSGLSSKENGNLFQLTFSGEYKAQKFSSLARINNFFNRIPRVRRYTQRVVEKYLLKNSEKFTDKDILRVRYNIPINMIDYFKPTESRLEYDSTDFFPENNLFLKIKRNAKSYDIDDFVQHNKIKGTDENRLERLNKKIIEKKLADFTLLYIGKGELAHMMGTQNETFHKKLKEYDKKLEKTKQLLDESYGSEYKFIILGDHGMVDVEQYINLNPMIKRLKTDLNLKIGTDFVYFIDSTAFRIWLKNKNLKDKCNEIIINYIQNYLEDIKIENNFYGDLIYILKPGNVFFPDFFNTKKNKGMHGYDNHIPEQSGLCVVIGSDEKNKYKSLELQDAKKLVEKFLELK